MFVAIGRLLKTMFSLPVKLKDEFWPIRFDELVRNYFGPIAQREELPLRKLRAGVFEIEGRDFAMRVREGIGHRRSFLITLVPPDSKGSDPDNSPEEIGLGVIAELRGEPLPERDMFTPGRFRRGFAEAVASTEKFLLPYLRGEIREIADIRQFIEQKIEASGIRAKKYRFRRNVREEWL